MKHILLSIALLVATSLSSVFAQTKTVVEVTDQRNEQLRATMSKAATEMITALNTGFMSKTIPALASVNMSNTARENALQIWECAHYRCIESEIYQRCLTTSLGFQIRNIPFIMEDGSRQDGVINFTSAGKIDAFYFAIDNHTYQDIIRANVSVTDLRRRQMILDFIENFRTAYNRKDLALIGSMYSDDAVIITGREYKTQSNDSFSGGVVIDYTIKNKKDYMKSLTAVFAKNPYVNVGFSHIDVEQHPARANIYGVTLRQAWNTTYYSDDGWLFLAIEFNDAIGQMLIHVRTWEPSIVNGKELERDEVFGLDRLRF